MTTFVEFAEMLDRAAVSLRGRLEADLAEIGARQAITAREMIGHELPIWKPLEPDTVAEKERLGYTGHMSATDPLLRTGEMRDSIRVEVLPVLEVEVGSNDPVMKYQEHGTQHIPPRPVLSTALVSTLPFVEETLLKTAATILEK